MAAPDRELLESDLGISVLSIYQAAEALRIGFQCEERRDFHLSIDSVAIRVVDEHHRDVAPGETGSIIVSNLVNRATVLLNYRLGDQVTLGSTPCPCGRTLPTISQILGRPSEGVLMPAGNTLHAGSILSPLQAVEGPRQVQIEQKELRDFQIRAVCRPDSDPVQVCVGLEAAARSVLGDDISVQIDLVDHIQAGPGGKMRAVISRCLESDHPNEEST